MKIEVDTGGSRPFAGGAADAAVKKRNAAGSALANSTDPDKSGLDSVRDIARDGSGDGNVAGQPDRRPSVADADQDHSRDGDDALVIKPAPDSPTA
jgi:hypothetical protein